MRKTATVLALLTMASAAVAADHFWVGPSTGGRWGDKTNWSRGLVPETSSDSCVFTNDATVVTDSNAAVSRLRFQNGCHVTFKGDGATGATNCVMAESMAFADGASFTLDGARLRIAGGYGFSAVECRLAVVGGANFHVVRNLFTGSCTVISNDNSTITVGGRLLMGQADKNGAAAGEQLFFAGEDAQMVVAGAVEFNNNAAASGGATFNFAVPERGFKDAPFRTTSRSRLFGNPTAVKPDGANEKFIHIVVSPSSPALDPAYGYATLSKLLFAPAGFPNLAFFDCRVEGAGNRAEFPFTKVDGKTQATEPAKVRYLVARMENGQGGKDLAMRTMTESKGVAENTTVSVYGRQFTLASAVSQLAGEPFKTFAVLHVGETAETLAPVGEKAISTPGDFKMTWDGVEYVKSYWFRVALETRTGAGDVTHVEWSPLRPAATPCCMSPRGSAEVGVVQTPNAYNSWPMVQAIGDKRLVCAYSRGSRHTVNEPKRGVYARVSDDEGATWSNEVCVCNSPEWGEVTVGKGLDASGAMLLWVRRQDQRGWLGGTFHDLYRTRDGLAYEKISSPKLNPEPIQITDVFALPEGRMMCLWFAGEYSNNYTNDCWGVLESTDNGATWRQRTVESGLRRNNWPTEPSAVHLGGGRILCIARCEGAGYQFQITSDDGGMTWKRVKTNISDVLSSTPSLILDASTGLLHNYYYQRQARLLKRRVADAAFIFDHPGEWPEPEVLAKGNEFQYWDAGNANATSLRGHHFAATYTGTETRAIVVTVRVPVP